MSLLTAEDSGFEGGTVGTWVAGTGSCANSVAQAQSGTHSLAITAVAGGFNASTAVAGAGFYPVSQGLLYTFSGWILAAATNLSVNIDINWFAPNGTFISNLLVGVNSVTSGWTQGSVTQSPPSGAGLVAVGWYVAAATAGQVYYVDSHYLEGDGPHAAAWGGAPGIALTT